MISSNNWRLSLRMAIIDGSTLITLTQFTVPRAWNPTVSCSQALVILGEEGARYSPSLMPGGSTAAWQSIKQGAHSIQELALKLRKARQIVLLIKASPAVDNFIKQLEAFLENGDH
jgi:hypothetical protein